MTPEEYIEALTPWVGLLQRYTKYKSDFLGRFYSSSGIRASVLLADLLLVSEFGEHPLVQEEYKGRYANNLALLRAPKLWSGKVQTYQGHRYRSYRTYHDFVTDFSDLIVFSGDFIGALCVKNIEDQIIEYSASRGRKRDYTEEIEKVIESYDLRRLDDNTRSPECPSSTEG